MALRTEVCDLLGIKYPILQGAFGGAGDPAFVAAVSEAGALGVIGSGRRNPEWVLDRMREVKAATKKPFGVNIVIRRSDHPMYPTFLRMIDFILAEKPALVITGGGDPKPLIPTFKGAGIKIVPVIGASRHAQRAEQAGVDMVIASGYEGGGHVGEVATMALIPQVVDVVKIPVVAAGGIGDGRGIVAALALGAKGIQIGTRFACTVEAECHANYKKAIVEADDRATAVRGVPFGDATRVWNNKHGQELEAMEKNPNATRDDYFKFIMNKSQIGFFDGDPEDGRMLFGQIAGLVHDCPTVKELMARLVAEAEAQLKRVGAMAD